MFNKCLGCFGIGVLVGICLMGLYVRALNGTLIAERHQRAIEMNAAKYDAKTGEFQYNDVLRYVIIGTK